MKEMSPVKKNEVLSETKTQPLNLPLLIVRYSLALT